MLFFFFFAFRILPQLHITGLPNRHIMDRNILGCLLPIQMCFFLVLHLVNAFNVNFSLGEMGTQWRSGTASNYELRGPGFNPHLWHHDVSLRKTH